MACKASGTDPCPCTALSTAQLPTSAFLCPGLGIPLEELDSFFNSAPDSLHTNCDGLQLPDVTLEALKELKTHRHFDRLIIYTDEDLMRCRPLMWDHAGWTIFVFVLLQRTIHCWKGPSIPQPVQSWTSSRATQ